MEQRIENVKSGVKIKNRKKEFIERDERNKLHYGKIIKWGNRTKSMFRETVRIYITVH